MKSKLVEIIYHRLPVKDVQSYRVRYRSACLLVEAIAKHFEVLSFKAALFNDSVQMDSAHYHFVNTRFYKLWIPFAFHLRIKDCQPDMVLIHGTFNHFQIMHLKWLLGTKCKLLVQHHGERPRGWMKRILLKWSSGAVDAYLFTSQEAALEMGVPENKVKLIMEGSTAFKPQDKQKCRNELGLASHEKIYLWVGRLVPVKNPVFFLKAFTEFSSTHPEARLYLFYHEHSLLEECLATTAASQNIVYLGKASAEELLKWYSASDYFVSASLHEGSGYALCEAMACGCVPIVPSISSFRFMTGDGESALMYNAENAESLRNKLEEANASNPEPMKKKVLQQFAKRLSFEAIASDLLRITNAL